MFIFFGSTSKNMVRVFMALIVDDKIQCDLQHCKCADNSSVVMVTFSHTSDVSIV